MEYLDGPKRYFVLNFQNLKTKLRSFILCVGIHLRLGRQHLKRLKHARNARECLLASVQRPSSKVPNKAPSRGLPTLFSKRASPRTSHRYIFSRLSIKLEKDKVQKLDLPGCLELSAYLGIKSEKFKKVKNWKSIEKSTVKTRKRTYFRHFRNII